MTFLCIKQLSNEPFKWTDTTSYFFIWIFSLVFYSLLCYFNTSPPTYWQTDTSPTHLLSCCSFSYNVLIIAWFPASAELTLKSNIFPTWCELSSHPGRPAVRDRYVMVGLSLPGYLLLLTHNGLSYAQYTIPSHYLVQSRPSTILVWSVFTVDLSAHTDTPVIVRLILV